jgi:hypothetical protein
MVRLPTLDLVIIANNIEESYYAGVFAELRNPVSPALMKAWGSKQFIYFHKCTHCLKHS